MIINLGIGISFIIVLLIIIFIFFSKERVKSIENEFFVSLIILTMIGLIIEMFIYFLVIKSGYKFIFFINFLTKMLYIYFLLWMYCFILYNFCVFMEIKSKQDEKYKKGSTFLKSIYFLFIIITIFLPIEITKNLSCFYPGGIGTYVQYLMSIIGFTALIIIGFKNKKLLTNKVSIPLIVCFILGFISIITQYYYNELMFIVPTHAIAVILMYHTIENPDIKMINALELAKEQAEKANRAKSDFLSSMSHEIRTPLNVIVGFSECITKSDDLVEIKEDAQDIVTASQNLLEIVNGILDISKIEADKMEIIGVNYSPQIIFDELIKIIKTRIGEKNIEIRTNYAVDIPQTLFGDKGKIKQIITNILTNAVKYTDKGFIDFEVKCINEKDICNLMISIKDTGRGIKPEQLDKLFTKFSRLEEDKNTTIEGTGLGLAITKRLVEMMNGKIVVQSTYGKGSTFIVYLPQKIADDNKTNEIKKETAILKTKFNQQKVLIVDDNQLNIKVAEKILKEFDLDITGVDSGFGCIDKIKGNEKYDIILLDIMMPKMDGVKTLQKLKEIPNFNIPVIALTADAMEGTASKYLNEGFDAYLAKPINKEELLKILNKYLK